MVLRAIALGLVALGSGLLVTACEGGDAGGDGGAGGVGGEDLVIQASSYDTTCAVDADCVLVAEGGVCGCGPCPNAAIHREDRERYQSDLARLQARCPPHEGPDCALGCESVKEVCEAGRCAVESCSGADC